MKKLIYMNLTIRIPPEENIMPSSKYYIFRANHHRPGFNTKASHETMIQALQYEKKVELSFSIPKGFQTIEFPFGKIPIGYVNFENNRENGLYFNDNNGKLFCLYLTKYQTFLLNDNTRNTQLKPSSLSRKKTKAERKIAKYEKMSMEHQLTKIFPFDILKHIEEYADSYVFQIAEIEYLDPAYCQCDYFSSDSICANCLAPLNEMNTLRFKFVNTKQVSSFCDLMDTFGDNIIAKLCNHFSDSFTEMTGFDIWKEILLLLKIESQK